MGLKDRFLITFTLEEYRCLLCHKHFDLLRLWLGRLVDQRKLVSNLRNRLHHMVDVLSGQAVCRIQTRPAEIIDTFRCSGRIQVFQDQVVDRRFFGTFITTLIRFVRVLLRDRVESARVNLLNVMELGLRPAVVDPRCVGG